MTSERFFFVHVLKTGGTDLFTRLGGDPSIEVEHPYHFDVSEIYPNDTDGDVFTVAPQLSVDQLLERWAVRRDEIRIVMGHFPLCTVELLDAPFVTLTVLREPVERTLSFLRHHRKLTPADRNKSFEEIYEDQFRFDSLIHNHMVKMFTLTKEDMTDGMLTKVDFTLDHLERAKQRLATVDVLGLQEHFEEFCAELTRRFGWDLGEPLWANRTQPADFSPELVERIERDNALDIEFYGFARSLYRERGARAGDVSVG
jgi:hypothetical protein